MELFPSEHKVLRVTILEAEGLRNVAVLKKTDSYVSAHLATRTEVREGRTSVKKVNQRDRQAEKEGKGEICRERCNTRNTFHFLFFW